MQLGDTKMSLNPKDNPLVVWIDTNNKLNEFYKRPEINLSDSDEDLQLKNTMRHIVGLARMAQNNSPDVARAYGFAKELLVDYGKDYIKHPFSKRSQDVVDDTNVDFFNNDIGIDYGTKNPNATIEDIMNFAYQQALQNRNKQYPQNELSKYLAQ